MVTLQSGSIKNEALEKTAGWRPPLAMICLGFLSGSLVSLAGGIGPCGPATPMALIFMLAAMLYLPAGKI